MGDPPGDVVRDDVAAPDHVLGVLLQPGVRKELVAVVRVLRLAVRDDDALDLGRNRIIMTIWTRFSIPGEASGC